MKQLRQEGEYIALGIAIGAGCGVAFGVALGNIALGIGPGIAVGVAVGAALENDAKKKGLIQPLAPGEKRRRRLLGWTTFIVGLVLVALIAVMYLR